MAFIGVVASEFIQAEEGVQLLQQPDRRRRFRLFLRGLDHLRDLFFDVGVPADQSFASYESAVQPTHASIAT
mgnify:CR=1 FL=1